MDNFLKPFVEEPEKEFHVRQLSKIFKKSPTTISMHLKNFEKKEILISQRKLNHLFFKANSENIKFKRIKLFYNLSILDESKLIDYLEKEFNPEAIVLFGSYAKAENGKKSDIDLLIISSDKKEINLKNFEKKIGNIQLHIFSKRDIESMKIKNKELLNNFINGIILYGYWELFI